jgi:hypothetical protein
LWAPNGLNIFSRNRLKRIKENERRVGRDVPAGAAVMVKYRQLFGHRDPEIPEDAALAAANR